MFSLDIPLSLRRGWRQAMRGSLHRRRGQVVAVVSAHPDGYRAGYFVVADSPCAPAPVVHRHLEDALAEANTVLERPG